MVKSGQTWSGLVVTKGATGALATPSVGPAGALYVDGVVNGATVAISGTNPYKWSVTLPALTAGQCVSMYITATIATIATASVVAEDVADTVALSEVSAALATVDGIVDGLAAVAPDYKPTVAVTGEAAANVTMQQGVAVAAADANGYAPVDVRSWGGEDLDKYLDDILTAIGNEIVEGSYTRDDILRIIAAALAGETSGSGTSTVTILGLDGATARITATVDGVGNRTGMTLDGEA